MAQSQEALGESNIVGNLLNTGYGQALTQAGNLANTQAEPRQEGAASSLASMYGNAGSAMAGYGQTDLSNALTTGAGLPQQYLQNLLGIGGLQQSQQQAGINAAMGNYYVTAAATDPEPRFAAQRSERRALRHQRRNDGHGRRHRHRQHDRHNHALHGGPDRQLPRADLQGRTGRRRIAL